jgi:hypothetical protein
LRCVPRTPLITDRLREAGIADAEQLFALTPHELMTVHGLTAAEVHDLIVRLHARGEAVASYPGRPGALPTVREIEVFRLRYVEGMTLRQTGEAVGISKERVRQIGRHYFGLPPFI